MKAIFVEARVGKSTMGKQLAGAEHRITTLKTQLDEAQLVLEKLLGELSSTEADL